MADCAFEPRTLSPQVSVFIKTKRATNLTHISEEINPSMILFTQLLMGKMVWVTNCTEIEATFQTWLLTSYKTSKTLLLLLIELSLPPPELKTIKNSLIWLTKKCSSLNYQPNLPQDHQPLIWEVKLETLPNQAPSMLLLLSKEPVTKKHFHCWLPKKFLVTTEEPEEFKETFSLKTPSLMELKLSAPATKILDFSD